ncbi:MAG TPA: 30S ribosomal protein S5, partial [Candidatus Latescibacteria bacterium]|nr:30S ribosomal protein S5 [Candidatus Latescibacterota bacterium]
PHEVWGPCGAGLVFLRPATPGTGLIAGSAARAVLEAAGVENVLSKSVGSANALNVARATLDALAKLRTFTQVRSERRLIPPETVAAETVDIAPAENAENEAPVETPNEGAEA